MANASYLKNSRVVRCIMPVHVLGNVCDMDRLDEIGGTI